MVLARTDSHHLELAAERAQPGLEAQVHNVDGGRLAIGGRPAGPAARRPPRGRLGPRAAALTAQRAHRQDGGVGLRGARGPLAVQPRRELVVAVLKSKADAGPLPATARATNDRRVTHAPTHPRAHITLEREAIPAKTLLLRRRCVVDAPRGQPFWSEVSVREAPETA